MSERLLLFVPMYNCAAQIPRVLGKLDGRARRLVARVIVVDNRSTDGGAEVAGELVRAMDGLEAAVLRNVENYGLGGSHKVAFEHAVAHGFDWVAVLHGDDQGELADLLDRVERGEHRDADAFLGARFATGSRLQGYSWIRTLGNHGMNCLFSIGAGRRIADLGSGLNLYRVEILRDRFWRPFPDDLTFNYCMTLAHAALRHRTTFFPILWREEDQVSNVKLVSQTVKVLKILASYVFGRRTFLLVDRRARPREAYAAEVVARSPAYPAEG